jgi:hypothetical protein
VHLQIGQSELASSLSLSLLNVIKAYSYGKCIALPHLRVQSNLDDPRKHNDMRDRTD